MSPVEVCTLNTLLPFLPRRQFKRGGERCPSPPVPLSPPPPGLRAMPRANPTSSTWEVGPLLWIPEVRMPGCPRFLLVFFSFPQRNSSWSAVCFFVYPAANLLTGTEGVLLFLRLETLHSLQVAREGQGPKLMCLKPYPGCPGQVPVKQKC